MISYPEAKRFASAARKVDIVAFMKSWCPERIFYDPSTSRYRDVDYPGVEFFKGDDGFYHYKDWDTRERASDSIQYLLEYHYNYDTAEQLRFTDVVELLLDFEVKQRLKNLPKTSLYEKLL